MSHDNREAVANWLVVLGAALVFVSLFLPWSHQLSAAVLSAFGRAPALQGVPTDPTAWQVYSAADVLLTLLSVGLVAAAAIGSHAARQLATVAAAIALVFVLHALAAPPTNGILVFNTIDNVPHPAPASPAAGPGETIALVGLLAALAGLALSFVADRLGAAAPAAEAQAASSPS